MTNRLQLVRQKELHETAIMSIPGVTGIALGKDDGVPCIIVYVTKNTSQLERAISSELKGSRVKIEESGALKALDD